MNPHELTMVLAGGWIAFAVLLAFIPLGIILYPHPAHRDYRGDKHW